MIEGLGGGEVNPIRAFLLFVRGVLRDRTELAAENLALRQQVATQYCPGFSCVLLTRDSACRITISSPLTLDLRVPMFCYK